MHPAFSRTDHRPWPVPSRPWTWRQTWRDLLFAHWPVPAEVLRPLVPSRLTIQECEGTSWIGVVPFRMTGVTRRPLPDLPWLSAFPELNLRLYVELDGKAGVWFLSLDAANPVAVWAARRFFHLPYFYADMSIAVAGDTFQYRSERRGATVRFAGSYRPTSPPYQATPGSLEHFLTERYCLYAQAPDGTLYRAEIHHVPWPLQKAEADFVVNEVATPHGLTLEGPPALLHFARKIDVVVWPLQKLETAGTAPDVKVP